MPAPAVSAPAERCATRELCPAPGPPQVSTTPRRSRGRAVSTGRLEVILRVFWFTFVPALLAVAALKFLVPSATAGTSATLSILHRVGEYPIVAGAALFLVFSGMARYWRSHLPGGPRAVSETERLAAPALATSPRREMLGVAAAVALAGAAALILRARVVDSYAVLSASMLPTFAPGDRVAASKLPYRVPERGDVIVFPSTAVASQTAARPEPFVKRVIGLPGDRVGMMGGIPIINGWKVPACLAGEYLYVAPDREGSALRGRLFVEFLDDRAYLTLQAPGAPEFPRTYEVMPGEVFVLGDNRNNSADSRVWNQGSGGAVPLRAVEARVKWFLSGQGLDGRAYLRRLFRSIDVLDSGPLTPRIDRRPLEEGIARCLEHRPKETRPPRAE
jgi:signal peptidase I